MVSVHTDRLTSEGQDGSRFAGDEGIDLPLAEARRLASRNTDLSLPENSIAEAILIRAVEERLLSLFSEGRMNGTVHTCVGQEFSAVCIAGQLRETDWITSNHRCHGHFISKTGIWGGLLDELMGLESGVCKGIGSSQHLYAPGFISNGTQGALLPVAAGMAIHNKRLGSDDIIASFIGEGTLGEGIVYETLNFAALQQLPQLFVCENNFYSQSTPQARSIAGTVESRAKPFGIATFSADTWDPANLTKVASEAIEFVRSGKPAFLTVQTYRLNAHSKGDDDRNQAEIAFFRARDPLERLLAEPRWQARQAEITEEVARHVRSAADKRLSRKAYLPDQLPRGGSEIVKPVTNPEARLLQCLNDAYASAVREGAVLLGEDIADPYGGAFTVTRGIDAANPGSVFTMPISEALIAGVAMGLALRGTPAYAEIMFGDFMSLTFDQILSNASKFHHMYGHQASCPARIRTPMGGKRGYGPTHSQSLEKFFVGIDNLMVMAVTSLLDPRPALQALAKEACPCVIIENKTDYARRLWAPSPAFKLQATQTKFPDLVISPVSGVPDVTIVSYGGLARELADSLEHIFRQTDCVPELICLTRLHPLDATAVMHSVAQSRRLVVAEEGSTPFGIGSELVCRVLTKTDGTIDARTVGADPVPIPSPKALEAKVLASPDKVIDAILELRGAEAPNG